MLNPTNLIFLVTLILFLIFIKTKKKTFLKLIKINFFLILFISIIPVGKFGLKYLEGNFIKQNTIENVKNIVVLAGAERLEESNITKKLNLNDSSERLIASITLANQFKDSIIIYVGGNGLMSNGNLSELDVAKKFYQELNFDMNRIIFLGNTRNTIENFKELKNQNIDSVDTVLITSAFHMKRSLMIAKKLKLKVAPYPVDFRSISYQSFINSYQKFSISSNLQEFDLFIREIIGILAFKILI